MKAVMSEVPPALLEERRRLGLDLFDEMWEGVLHMNPPPSGGHQRLGTDLLIALAPIARANGLVPHYETGFYAQPHDYRSPGHAYARPDQLTEAGVNGAELVIELRSPHDETDDKLDWYVARGVREIAVIHPSTRAIELFRNVSGRLRLVDPGPDRSVGLLTLGGTRLATVETADGPRLRVTGVDGSITYC